MLVQLKSMLEKLLNRGPDSSIRLYSPSMEPSASGRSPSQQLQPEKLAQLVAPTPGRSGISFSVDQVEPAAKPLWLSTLGEALELRAGASILVMPEQELPALAIEGYVPPKSKAALEHPAYVPPIRSLRSGVSLSDSASFPKAWADQRTFVHPLIEAVHRAFSDHRPLVLSPDAIWLTILQGFAHHLHQHAEAFRGRIVSHRGKKKLSVQTRSLEAGDWPQLISQLTAQIRANSDPFLYETLSCEFSTTTPTIKTACQIALMETYERYFEYVLMCVCGIPKVTLEGAPEDWQRIRERLEVLATFDLEWWTSRVAPILDQFVSTAKGTPDLAFWQAIYKPRDAYAVTFATGWIADLFPYLGRRSSIGRNPNLERERIAWLPQSNENKNFPGVSLEAFPAGISCAPVTVAHQDGSNTPVDLLGGFFGVSQAPEDGALAPIISWALVQKDARVSPPIPNFQDPAQLEALMKEQLAKPAEARKKARQSEN